MATGRNPSDSEIFPEPVDRESARIVKNQITNEIERSMLRSTETRGTGLWTQEVFSLLDDKLGGSEEEGRTLLDTFDTRVNERIRTLSNTKWDMGTATGQKAAADLLLDHLGLFPNEVSDDFYEQLQNNVANYPSLSDALNDADLTLQIGTDSASKYLEDASDSREAMNTEASLIKGIKSAALSQGFLSVTSSKGFQDHFDTNVVPEVARRIINAGGISSIEEIDSYVSELLQAGDIFKSYDLKEEGSGGYSEQFNPAAPPSIPGTFEWEGKSYDLMNIGPSGKPLFEFPNFAQTQTKWEAPDFTFEDIAPELQGLFTDKPDFANWLVKEMQDPKFKDEWEKAAKPSFDEEAYSAQLEGLVQQALPDVDTWKEAQKDIDEAQAFIDKTAPDEYADFPFEPSDPGLSKAYAALEAAKKQQQDIIGPPPPGTTKEGEPTTFPGMQGDPFAIFDKETREAMRQQYTTAGMTQQKFFESRLPGFEERYRQSPLYLVEKQQREEREEAKRKQKEREERTEVSRVEAERRRRVGVGTGGRGLTVFRRRQ